MIKQISLCITLLTIGSQCFAADSLRCIVKGFCTDFKAEEATISRATVDSRYHGERVPIKDGSFEYKISSTGSEAYTVTIKNVETKLWHNALFFSENGTIELQFSEAKKPLVEMEASTMNDIFQAYKEEYKAAQKRGFDGKNSIEWKMDYAARNQNEIGYYLLIDYLRTTDEMHTEREVESMVKTYELLSKKFPQHNYTSQGYELVKGVKNIKVGGKYIDFSAPDLEGKLVKVSEIIGGKIAVIDLWASWCSPCRAKSIKLKAIYEKYHSRGFEVIGVAREFKNSDKMVAALQKDGYPWKNLLELDDKLNIWNMYMIGNSGGALFMVDREGRILHINPTPEQIESELLRLK